MLTKEQLHDASRRLYNAVQTQISLGEGPATEAEREVVMTGVDLALSTVQAIHSIAESLKVIADRAAKPDFDEIAF